MHDFTYYTPTRVVFGKNTEQQTGALVKACKCRKVLIHFGGQSALRSGLVDRIKTSLEAEGLTFVTLGGVVPNPRLSLIREGIELARGEEVDFVLAVGGGSVIDSAKAIAYGAANEGDVWDYYMPGSLHFEMPKVDNECTESLTDEQLAAYLKAIDDEPDQNAAGFLRLALVTGMRKGALLALRWTDCDFERGIITLRGASAKKGKTEFIPMTTAARAILGAVEHTASPYVFPGKDGGQRQDFRRMARRVRDNAGLPKDFRPLHGLRHAYASMLISSGKVDLYSLQKLLTHSNPAMTQRYSHLRDEALRKAASAIDDCMNIDNAEK